MKTRLKYYGVAFVIALTCMIIFNNIFVGGLIAFTVLLIAYLWISITRAKYRLSLLDDQCDPYGFLEKTLEQKEITGRNKKLKTYLDMDVAAAYLTMGKASDALEILQNLNTKYMSKNTGIKLVYTINLMEAYYVLGQNQEADYLFENEIPHLSARGKHLEHAMAVLLVERSYFRNQYEDCREKIEILLGKDIKTRLRVSLIFRQALMNEKEGKTKEALKQYKEVAEKGNKLYIADFSKDQVMKLEKQI